MGGGSNPNCLVNNIHFSFFNFLKFSLQAKREVNVCLSVHLRGGQQWGAGLALLLGLHLAEWSQDLAAAASLGGFLLLPNSSSHGSNKGDSISICVTTATKRWEQIMVEKKK